MDAGNRSTKQEAEPIRTLREIKDYGGTSSSEDNAESFRATLKRDVGLFSALNLIVGVMIGSGIFVTPSVVLQNSGSVGVALLLWIGAGIMALFGGLCYSELAGLVPASGGEYAYNIAASRSLGRYWDLVPFLYAWGYTFAVGPASSAIQGQIMASYALSIPYADCDPPRVLHILVTFACIGDNDAPHIPCSNYRCRLRAARPV